MLTQPMRWVVLSGRCARDFIAGGHCSQSVSDILGRK
jgi:hypothetical protein